MIDEPVFIRTDARRKLSGRWKVIFKRREASKKGYNGYPWGKKPHASPSPPQGVCRIDRQNPFRVLQ